MTKAQLRTVGLGDRAIEERAAAGRLQRVHRGVFAVGHGLLSLEGRWMAAVLACGRCALLSHRSAAALWGVRPTARSAIDVISRTRAGRTQPGLDVHRARRLAAADRATVREIPCTSLARTLLDLAEVVPRRALEKACNQAETLQLLDVRAVHDVLDRTNGRRGAAVLRDVLHDELRAHTDTNSGLEESFLGLCRSEGLPQPRCNAWMWLTESEAVKADFLWPAQRLVVETDGRPFHATRRAFEDDRRRDQLLTVAGYRVVRFTGKQVEHRPAEVAGVVRRLLAALTPP